MLKVFGVKEEVKVKFPKPKLFGKTKYIEKDVEIFYYAVAETKEEAVKKLNRNEFLNKVYQRVYFCEEASLYLEKTEIEILDSEAFAGEVSLTISEILKELDFKDACALLREQGLNINI